MEIKRHKVDFKNSRRQYVDFHFGEKTESTPNTNDYRLL